MRLITKSDRLQVQKDQFDSLLKKGYNQDFYNGLVIFTINEESKFFLKIFRNTSSKHICFYAYRSIEQMNEAIERYKGNEDRNIAYKAECKANPKKSTAANAAAAIRKELKDKFSSVKFTVTSDNFAGGNAVRIGWTDGPTSNMVDDITGKYQYGHFNGMEDIYENTNSRDDIPQAKYVSTSRTRSEEVSALLPKLVELLGGYETDYNNSPDQILYRLFAKTPITGKITGIERTETMSGSIEDFYRITFEETEAPKEAVNYEPVEVKTGEINIIDYSDKAIAVIGDTKPIKNKLKELRGRFNFRLTCGPGWIFPKTKLEDIKAALKGINSTKKQPHV